MQRIFWATLIWVLSMLPTAAENQPLPKDPLAAAFGKAPEIWGARLSPDGSKISFLTTHPEKDLVLAGVMDAKTGNTNIVLASARDTADLQWCRWANEERLLCSFFGIKPVYHVLVGFTRLVGVNAEGRNIKVLMQKELRYSWSQFQDNIIDWLPDDPRHVLAQMPADGHIGVVKLDIYDSSTEKVARLRQNARAYLSDGRGNVRLFYYYGENKHSLYYQPLDGGHFRELISAGVTEDLEYYPIGFGDDPNHLYIFKPYEGRQALWRLDLNNNETTLVFTHPDVDVNDVTTIGKYNRIAAAAYETEKSHLHFFDPTIAKLSKLLEATFPGKAINVADESWNQKFYLVYVSSDRDPGLYYYFDAAQRQLIKIFPPYPALKDKELAAMTPIRYKARDGVEIPGYLTLPLESEGKNLPLVLLPHGGPESRDSWGYNFLVQYIAAKGYAVLQMNFRGSGGYGEEWAGEGGFKAWRQAINDITDGLSALVADGTADPNRVCAVGWSYGGYAALMSGVMEPGRYRCLVSVAGVTDPSTLIRNSRNYVGWKGARDLIGTEDDVTVHGSPLKRAAEIQAPVLLLHGDRDATVYVQHSEKMANALKKNGKYVDFTVYKGADHGIWQAEQRIDLLTRLGAFLDQHLGSPAAARTAAAAP